MVHNTQRPRNNRSKTEVKLIANYPSNSIEIQQNTQINLKSHDKEKLGRFAAQIRSWRPPEPYKGKGISYQGEIIKRKAGKSGKT